MQKKENPFNKSKQERLWYTWEEQQHYKKLSEDFSSFELDDWDKSFFIPEIWDRLKYVEKILNELKAVCAEENLARDLDVRLKPILLPEKFKLNVPEPQVGEQYLKAVIEMIDSQYLKSLTVFFKRYEAFKFNPSIGQAFNFLNESRFIFDMIVQTKNDPFTYHFKAFPSVKNMTTGEVIADEPKEIAITLKPFEVKINEMANVCKRSSDSIDLWVNKRRDSKKDLVQFALSQSQVDVAFYQKKSTVWATLFQILTIIFTIAVIILGDRTTLYFENQNLIKNTEEYKQTSRALSEEILDNKRKLDEKNELIKKLKYEVQSLKNYSKNMNK